MQIAEEVENLEAKETVREDNPKLALPKTH